MREIKFRAWFKSKPTWCNQMFYQDEEAAGIGDWFSECEGEYNHQQSEPIWMQYTGLKDKNGKEIYEGDILLIPDVRTDRIPEDGSGPKESCNHLSPVIFQDGSFGVSILETADYYRKGFLSFAMIKHDIGDSPEEFEVIDNIYENPELVIKCSSS